MVKKSAAKFRQSSQSCGVVEYPLGDQNINGALISLNGRYPESGRVRNKESRELVQILKGKVVLEVEGERMELVTGDQVLIEPGERYFWDGKSEFLLVSNPAWSPDQYEEVW